MSHDNSGSIYIDGETNALPTILSCLRQNSENEQLLNLWVWKQETHVQTKQSLISQLLSDLIIY